MPWLNCFCAFLQIWLDVEGSDVFRQHIDGPVILLHDSFDDHERAMNRLAALLIHGRWDDDVHHPIRVFHCEKTKTLRRRWVLARDDQAADLDLLTVLQARQLADRLCACASERIPPRRSQMSFQADASEGKGRRQPRPSIHRRQLDLLVFDSHRCEPTTDRLHFCDYGSVT